MNISEIQDLIKLVSRSGVTEVAIEQKDMKITIKSDPNARKRKSKGQEDQQGMPQQVPVMPMPAMQPMQPMQQQPQPQPQAQQPQPQAQPQQEAPQQQGQDKKDDGGDENYITVKSPMIGTFYRSSGPDKDPYVSVGDEIKPGKVICIIEAMKLFNEIEAEMSGRIAKVLVDDASPVEYDQPLFLVEPSK